MALIDVLNAWQQGLNNLSRTALSVQNAVNGLAVIAVIGLALASRYALDHPSKGPVLNI